MRELATAVGDPSITEDQAHIEVELVDGQKLAIFIEKSLGNLNRPMTDRQLDTKFRDQAVLAIPAGAGREALLNLCWRIDEVDDVNEVVEAAVPPQDASERVEMWSVGARKRTIAGRSPCPPEAARTFENPKLDREVKFRGSQMNYSGPRPLRPEAR